MNSKIKNINTFTREVSVNVPWENLKDDFKKCFFDFKKGYSMPGFRKGKVPDAIVKKIMVLQLKQILQKNQLINFIKFHSKN